MIDPKMFIKTDPSKNTEGLKDMDGAYACPEPGCFEIARSGKYDEENRKIFWVCPNGHEGSARL